MAIQLVTLEFNPVISILTGSSLNVLEEKEMFIKLASNFPQIDLCTIFVLLSVNRNIKHRDFIGENFVIVEKQLNKMVTFCWNKGFDVH